MRDAPAVFGGIFDRVLGSVFSPSQLFRPGDAGFWAGGFDPATARVFTDSGVTAATTFGQAIGQVTRRAGTLNAVQATAGDRPILARRPKGGRRNLILSTENGASAWSLIEITQAAAAAQDASLTAIKIIPTVNNTQHRIKTSNITSTNGQVFPTSFRAKADGYRYLVYGGPVTGTGNGVVFDLQGGVYSSSVAGATVTMTATGDGWYAITVISTSGITGSDGVNFFVNNVYSTTLGGWAGDGTSGIVIHQPQIEYGAAATAYQRVGTVYDITETGRPDRWALVNVSGDSLPLILPAGTYTVAWVTPAGVVTIQTGQSLSGAYSILRGVETCEPLVINRNLSVSQQADLTSYLRQKYAA